MIAVIMNYYFNYKINDKNNYDQTQLWSFGESSYLSIGECDVMKHYTINSKRERQC